MPAKRNDEVRNAILAMHADGKTPKEIAESLGRTLMNVRYYLVKAGMIAVSSNPIPRAKWVKTESTREEIKRRHEIGETRQQIADALGMTVPSVRYHLLSMGLVESKKFKPFTEFTPEMIQAITDEYQLVGGQPLADRFGCSLRTIVCKASLMGVRSQVNTAAINGKIRQEQNTTMNLEFFDTWTPESAYVLGYIWADGCIKTEYDKPAGLSFICTATDEALLRDVAKLIGYTGNFRYGKPFCTFNELTGKTTNTKRTFKFEVGSILIARKLMDNHGLAPRKSTADLPFPTNIPDEMMSHFARGNLDGDGSICVREKRAAIYFCGSNKFIIGLSSKISELTGSKKPTIGLNKEKSLTRASWSSKNDVINIGNWLYKNQTICLARKESKFRDACKLLESVKARTKQ